MVSILIWQFGQLIVSFNVFKIKLRWLRYAQFQQSDHTYGLAIVGGYSPRMEDNNSINEASNAVYFIMMENSIYDIGNGKHLLQGRYDFGICSWGSNIAVAGGRGEIMNIKKAFPIVSDNVKNGSYYDSLLTIEIFCGKGKNIKDYNWVLVNKEMKEPRINCSCLLYTSPSPRDS